MATSTNRVHLVSDQIQHFLVCTHERACTLTALFNKIFPTYQLNTLPRIHMALAQMAHESMGFQRYVENMNYSAQALRRTWPARFRTDSIAEAYARKPEKIANYVYGGRMGNTEPGDGWAFRGSGAIQVTGKDNVKAYSDYKGFSDIYDTAKLMRETDEFAIDSACWFMVVYKDLLNEIDRQHLTHVTSGINGGLIGLEQRKELYERAKRFITG